MIPEMRKPSPLKVIKTVNGPHVYYNNTRIHHWIPGALLAFLGTLGIVTAKKDKNIENYKMSIIVGGALIIHDLPDFLSFLDNHKAKNFRKRTPFNQSLHNQKRYPML